MTEKERFDAQLAQAAKRMAFAEALERFRKVARDSVMLGNFAYAGYERWLEERTKRSEWDKKRSEGGGDDD